MEIDTSVRSLINELEHFFAKDHAESSKPDVFAELIRYEEEAERLADKYQSYSSMLPEGTTKDVENSLTKIAKSLQEVSRFVRSELDNRGYKPSELPVVVPNKTSL